MCTSLLGVLFFGCHEVSKSILVDNNIYPKLATMIYVCDVWLFTALLSKKFILGRMYALVSALVMWSSACRVSLSRCTFCLIVVFSPLFVLPCVILTRQAAPLVLRWLTAAKCRDPDLCAETPKVGLRREIGDSENNKILGKRPLTAHLLTSGIYLNLTKNTFTFRDVMVMVSAYCLWCLLCFLNIPHALATVCCFNSFSLTVKLMSYIRCAPAHATLDRRPSYCCACHFDGHHLPDDLSALPHLWLGTHCHLPY